MSGSAEAALWSISAVLGLIAGILLSALPKIPSDLRTIGLRLDRIAAALERANRDRGLRSER